MPKTSRRTFLEATATSAAALALPRLGLAEDTLDAIRAEVEKRHDEGVKCLQDWVKQPSIAAENRAMNEGCDLMMQLARDAGFQSVSRVDTDGHPGLGAYQWIHEILTSARLLSRIVVYPFYPRFAYDFTVMPFNTDPQAVPAFSSAQVSVLFELLTDGTCRFSTMTVVTQ